MEQRSDLTKSKPNYMAAWVQQSSILWGTVSAVFVFTGLVLNALASDRLTIVAAALLCAMAGAGLLAYWFICHRFRLNRTALEFYLREQEKGHDWPPPPPQTNLKPLVSSRVRRPVFTAGGLRVSSRWDMGSALECCAQEC